MQIVVKVEATMTIPDEGSIEKLNLYFGQSVTKNIAFGNNTIFLQHFAVSGDFPFPWLCACFAT